MKKLPELTLDDAEKLWPETDYADLAAEQKDNPINNGDASAFFLEGYLHAKKLAEKSTCARCAELERRNAELAALLRDLKEGDYLDTTDEIMNERITHALAGGREAGT